MVGVRLESKERFDWLHMELGKANAIGPDFLRAFAAVWDQIDKPPQSGVARPLLLTGQGSAFSAGLELPALMGTPRAELAVLLGAFHRMVLRLACLGRPTIAVVNGHAVAGGAVLALACDVRIAARTVAGSDKPLMFGLNESAIGLPFPLAAQVIVERALGGPAGAADAMLSGELVSAERALAWRAVHRVVAADELTAVAEAEALRYTTATAAAAKTIKAALTRDVAPLLDDPTDESVFLDAWFAPGTQSKLSIVVARLKAR